jgi:hypothetical protein
MRIRSILAAFGVALAFSCALPSTAQAHWWWHHHYWHHWYHHWVAPTIVDVSYWWEVPYYYYSPYSIVDHVLVNHSTEVGPIHYPIVLVPPPATW